ncbi:ATP-dependent zinc metalloprotease FtsH 2 [Colletotrichum fructicola]|uniref:ATP-dependent zinc metalloprotease FtsH 2 n=2 Tax=Colletotrichum fructicola (strain Nara gc5) TaxID=1213859 RepID=A0A7J6IK85_COLFN|nr:ATP-dependent zinc metalloprotease FtsH 2 [Colletotrichum fructicola Nara gc5]KAF4882182.1 ATP-dependent zinc metalloprotease FtsH 2 [Colletotrichum fructicola]KAF4885215.1 ATP-dependent zinc metalloprotease FtsH 2 [Colletotrichum fructicola]KAF4923632.1 ATP-dependent zinc metalloprotease FtsH 2 [Colletotrichum fructicola]
MGDIAVDITDRSDGSKARSRILRYDEVFDTFEQHQFSLGFKVSLEIMFHSRMALQEKLEQARAAEPIDEDLVSELAITTDFAQTEHVTQLASLSSLLDAGEITWELLWTIFPPNILVYRYHRLVEQDQVLELRSIKKFKLVSRPSYWQLNCRIVTDDGVKFGFAYEPFQMLIEEFSGTRKIVDLHTYPLSYHSNPADVRAEALSRGRRYTALREPCVMETSGPAMFEKRDSQEEAHVFKFASQGRTIIDPAGFRSFNPNIEFMPDVHRGLSRQELTDEQLIVSTPVAFGFCFGNKKWGAFAMSRLKDVDWDDQAFKDLVLDKSKKMLVRSMVKQHSSKDDEFDDIVKGKGKGIVCLFSGPPGSGKTLTAEAVAELTKRPLYSVSAGDLGIDPETVDKRLSEVLEQSHKWNAVLLLDEADVFLQQRESHDIKRNALVSIFLRQLEYYQGILILTTNQIAQCDAAFESRVHISHEYPDLDETARRQIWEMFLRRLKDVQKGVAIDVTEEDISHLAKIKMNGRKIKNTLNSARIVAKDLGEVFSISHIKLVLGATKSGVHMER